MKSFSELLKYYIHAKNVKVAAMAEYLKLDRANLYKSINGKRIPASKNVAQKIALYLELSPTETVEFMDAYHIAEIGEPVYYQRKSVQHLLNSCFSHCDLNLNQEFYTGTHLPADTVSFQHTAALHGTQQIQQMLSLILADAAKSNHARICIAAQPDWDYLFTLLQTLGHLEVRFTVEHIVCLNSGHAPAGYTENVYNIRCIEKLIPLISCNCTYTPYFYYDSIDSHFNNLQLFSYAVITDRYVLTCSSDIQYGMLLCEEDLVHLYQDHFYRKLEHVAAAFHVIRSNVEEYMNITLKSLGHVIDATPCFLLFTPADMLQKLLLSEGAAADDRSAEIQVLLPQILAYQKAILSFYRINHFPLLTFSDVGIQYFMETGRVDTYPSQLYPPVPMEMRLQLLQILCDLPDELIPLRFRGSLSQLSPYTSIIVNERNGYFLSKNASGQLVYVTLLEKTMLHAMFDFIAHLKEENHLYSPEESRTFLRKLMQDYR